jgi:transposase
MGVMDGPVLDDCRTANNSGSWQDQFHQLRRELTQLRGEVDTLRRDNLELRQQAGFWKAMHGRALERIAVLQQDNEQLRGDVRRLQDQLFGQKSEKQSHKDRSNYLPELDDADDAAADAAQAGRSQPPRQGPQRRDYSHLSKVEEVVELPEAQRICPYCGQLWRERSDTEDSEQIEIEVKAYRRVIRRRRYQASCACVACQTRTAPPRPKLIPKSLFGTSVWVEILLDKYFSHRPTERLLTAWDLLGLDLAASTVAGGLQRLVPLLEPLYLALQKRNRQSAYQQADETRWLVFIELQGKQGHRWWLWVFVGEDSVVYVLDPHRSHDVPEGHFSADVAIVLMVDRLSSYKAMAQVKEGLIVLAFCWAHVRRDFIAVAKSFPKLRAWALDWLRRIRRAYRLNDRRLEQLDKPAFLATDAALHLVLDEMKSQAALELADTELRQPCRKTLVSLQEHWTGLTRFVDDPRIPMDNNRSERHLRGPAVGRKNYYGSAAAWSGQLAAMMFSLLATLQRWELNPRTWLRWYLDGCADAGGKAPASIEGYLPWNMNEAERQAASVPMGGESVLAIADTS